jgi:hypothetical protein
MAQSVYTNMTLSSPCEKCDEVRYQMDIITRPGCYRCIGVPVICSDCIEYDSHIREMIFCIDCTNKKKTPPCLKCEMKRTTIFNLNKTQTYCRRCERLPVRCTDCDQKYFIDPKNIYCDDCIKTKK